MVLSALHGLFHACHWRFLGSPRRWPILIISPISADVNLVFCLLQEQSSRAGMATGGYPATTADNALRPGLQCPHCELFLKEAVQTSEGLRLCRSCFTEIRRSVEEKIYGQGECVCKARWLTILLFRVAVELVVALFFMLWVELFVQLHWLLLTIVRF